LTPFQVSETIPFEAALAGKLSYGIDISLPAYYISYAKVNAPIPSISYAYINALTNFIKNNKCTKKEIDEVKTFGFNKKLSEYYEEKYIKRNIACP
jgi:hypothetical protein